MATNFLNKLGGGLDKLGEGIDNLLGSQQTKDILINSQIPLFRGYGKDGNIEMGNSMNLELEDPSYIIFDINIVGNSSLFSQVTPFLEKYGKYDREIEDVYVLYSEFIEKLKLIFPIFGENTNKSGQKRHYINSISGLDNLNKTTINYPEDKITFKLSEDITMLVQYLSELYSNLTYSFASNRQLIPSNLLLFDMYIILSDVRDMKKGLKKYDKGYFDQISEDKSKFIYVLHDCEFNFFTSKLHTDEVVVGGYGQGPTTTPSTTNIHLNYKSYSRILSSSLISGAYLLDYRLKTFGFDQGKTDYTPPIVLNNTTEFDGGTTTKYEDFYNKFNNDYKTQDEYLTNNKTRYNISGVDEPNSTSSKGYFNKLARKGLNTAKGIGSSMINKLHNEVDTLKGTVQKGISTALGINVTLTKINVYFETPEEKLDRLAMLASNIADNVTRNLNKTIENGFKDLGGVNGNSNRTKNTDFGSMGNNIGKDALDGLTSTFTGKHKKGESIDSNLYGRDKNTDYTRSGKGINNSIDDNDKLPTRGQGDVYLVGENELYYINNNPKDTYQTNLYRDQKTEVFNYTNKDKEIIETFNNYHDKEPNDVNDYDRDISKDYTRSGKGINKNIDDNDKKPTDTLLNKKITIGNTGDLQPNGTYHDKEPNDVNNYGRKVNQDYMRSGKSMNRQGDDNDKKPTDILKDSKSYNYGTTIGDTGDLHPDGVYHKKYYEGDVHPNSTYNEKLPSGDVHVNATYNQKIPTGDRQPNSTYNEKLPSGDRQPNGTYNEKLPTGDRQPNGTYNEKLPTGDRQPNGTYNEKFPDGDKQPDGQYNIKFPDGDRHPDGTYNQKFSEGDRLKDGQYNIKFTEKDNVYLKNNKRND